MNTENRVDTGWPQAAIFDMDGTLFRTETLLVYVHERLFQTLREEGLYTEPTPPIDRLLACLGMLLDDIWRLLIPDASDAARERADQLMLEYELQFLEEGRGELYSGVEDTLRQLKKGGVKLFVASNGLEHYVKGVAKYLGIAELFDGLYSAGQYATSSKVDLVKRLLEDHRLPQGGSPIWMVGDRHSDVEAGRHNGLLAIGCRYAGFGDSAELDEADVLIDGLPALLELAQRS